MAEWIVLGPNRAINLEQVSDIKFTQDAAGTYATVRLTTFNPTTSDKQESTWFNVTGPDVDLPRTCIARHLAPEFAAKLGTGGIGTGDDRGG